MKNKESWKPNKFVYKKGKLGASRDVNEVGISSRLGADIIAQFYENNIKEYAHGRLLDLGCGKVPLYHAYKDYIEENICVDWGNSFHKNEHLDFTMDLNEKLSLSDGEFNTVILSDVLEHIKEPRQLCIELNRILKENGILIMNVPFFYWLHEEPHDYYRYTQHALRSLAEESGFRIIKLEPTGGVPEILADILAKSFIGIRLIGKLSAIIIQNFTWFFIHTTWGKKIVKNSSQHFPFGYFLIAKKINN